MKGEKAMNKTIRIASLIILLISVFVTVDFGLTFLYSLIPESNDGIVGASSLMCLLGGEDGWSRAAYFEWFRNSLLVTLAIAAENAVLSIINMIKNR